MNYKLTFKSEKGKKDILEVYDRILKRWPVPYEEMQVDTPLGSTNILLTGDKSANLLVLLHGTGSNSSMWVGDIAAYSENYRVLAVDIPGEPGKSGDRQYPLESGMYSEWLAGLLDSLGYSKISLVGLSLGGWMALAFAVRYPQRVEKLALISTSGIGPQKISFIFRMIPLMLLGEKGFEKIARIVNGGENILEEAVRYTMLIARNFNLRSQVPIFSDDDLKHLDMPVMLFAGEKDVLLHSRKTVARVRKLLPAADVRLLPGAGHVLIHLRDDIIEFLRH